MICNGCGNKKAIHIKSWYNKETSKMEEVCDVCGGLSVNAPLPEFTTENIRSERQEYFKSLIQPFRGGELSKEYVEAYPKHVKKIRLSISMNIN